MKLFDRDRAGDPDWHIFQMIGGFAVVALIGGIALLWNADLASTRGLVLGAAGIGLILLAVLGVKSWLDGDWDRQGD